MDQDTIPVNGEQQVVEQAVLTVAKEELAPEETTVLTLARGVRAHLVPVASRLLDEVRARVPDPPVPVVKLDDGREVENPDDPDYQRSLERAAIQRIEAASDAYILFGVELIDGVPPVGEWLPQLRLLEKLGHVDLGRFDLTDPTELEFVYKKLVAVAQVDLRVIAARSGGVREEDIQKALAFFRRQTPRGSNRAGGGTPSPA